VGFAATFLTFLVAHQSHWEDSLMTAFAISISTHLWIGIIVGLLLSFADRIFPNKSKWILGFSVVSVILIAAFGWIIAYGVMHA
jgi:ABC-type nickel/cobalt efflux system permease component RcnA